MNHDHSRLVDVSLGSPVLEQILFPFGHYFTMLGIGLVLAIYLASRWAKRHDLNQGKMIDFGIWMGIWGIVGSRILHVFADGHFWDYVHVCTDPSLVEWQIDIKECKALSGVWDSATQLCHPAPHQGWMDTLSDCFAWADISAGGFAYYGGLIAAGIFSVYFIRRHNFPAAKVCDMAGWGITLGLVWGRMGCFMATCCFGKQTDFPLAVVFRNGSAASRTHWKLGLLDTYRTESLPVHATQIYEASLCFIIAVFAYFILRPRKTFDGQVFVISMALYAVGRFMLEFVRDDERGGLFGFSTSQLIAIGILWACAFLWRYFKNKAATAMAS